MPAPKIHEHNISTGQITQTDADNAHIIANRPNEVQLTLADTSKSVGETEALSLQMRTHTLADDTQSNVSQVATVKLQIGDKEYEITTDANGAWSDTLEFVHVGTYEIKALSHISNTISVVVS